MPALKRKRLIVFRHGQTDWNALERFQGFTDIPLNDTGRAQARELGLALKNLGIQGLLASDLSRAIETAEIVSEITGAPLFARDRRFKESNLGIAEGLTRTEIEERIGSDAIQLWRSWDDCHLSSSYPEGETGHQVQTRVMSGLRYYLEENPVTSKLEVLALAAHGGVMRRLIQKAVGLPEHGRLQIIPNGEYFELEWLSGEKLFRVLRAPHRPIA